jgi:hypothetical protein
VTDRFLIFDVCLLGFLILIFRLLALIADSQRLILASERHLGFSITDHPRRRRIDFEGQQPQISNPQI